MKLEKFEVRFENDRGVFVSGEHVKGEVIIKLTQPMKMRSIVIYFEGRAKAHWEVKHGRTKTDYRGNEGYIQHQIKLYGTGQASVEHPAGFHKYPFFLALQPTLPSSFEGRRGYVRYFCRATIDRPWKFDEHTKRAFTVIHHLDLNFISNAAMPIEGEQEQTIESCCCSSGTVTGRLLLNKTGYVPGEPIVFTIDVYNKSDSNVERIELELRQIVTYTGFSDSIFSSGNPKQHTKLDQFDLLSHPCRIKQNMEEHINRGGIIPALPPSGLEGCGIIDIQYIVALKVHLGWNTLTIERGIIIGTIPLHQPQGVPGYTPALGPSVPSAPPTMEQPPPYCEPPPSYEESVFGRTEIRDENDDAHTSGLSAWAPSYPYYTWNPTAQVPSMPSAFSPPPGEPGAPITTQPTAPPPAYNQI
ncbi:arrestin domain-containing protein 17-like [Haliotis rufescens]|uniref:arrestin domain-containing protein 17-like n=1 Tax=Haliotis rufescens TaxID=6454 RepID=UPI001EAFD1A7|nr:arrestin domain-containing protein 17-like [Haliotis rufescens]